jgi:hypothetical protein
MVVAGHIETSRLDEKVNLPVICGFDMVSKDTRPTQPPEQSLNKNAVEQGATA